MLQQQIDFLNSRPAQRRGGAPSPVEGFVMWLDVLPNRIVAPALTLVSLNKMRNLLFLLPLLRSTRNKTADLTRFCCAYQALPHNAGTCSIEPRYVGFFHAKQAEMPTTGCFGFEHRCKTYIPATEPFNWTAPPLERRQPGSQNRKPEPPGTGEKHLPRRPNHITT